VLADLPLKPWSNQTRQETRTPSTRRPRLDGESASLEPECCSSTVLLMRATPSANHLGRESKGTKEAVDQAAAVGAVPGGICSAVLHIVHRTLGITSKRCLHPSRGVAAGWAWAVARPGLPRIRTCALTHPARRVHRFAARRYPPQLRQDRVSDRCPIGLSLQRFRAPVPLFPPRGPSAVPPLRRYFRGTPTPHGPSRLTSLPSLSGTAVTSSLRSSRGPDAERLEAWAFGRRWPPSGILPAETLGSPRFLGEPFARLPSLLDPGGISA
jgi:hypothetical protein